MLARLGTKRLDQLGSLLEAVLANLGTFPDDGNA
jgi:hypothetical protein